MENMDNRLCHELFIKCYRDNPYMWDASKSDYWDQEKRRNGYSKLLHILQSYKKNATINEVKMKINSIRCNYKRELNKVKKSEANGKDVYEPQLWWFPLMDFLRNAERPVKKIVHYDMKRTANKNSHKQKTEIHFNNSNEEQDLDKSDEDLLVKIFKDEELLYPEVRENVEMNTSTMTDGSTEMYEHIAHTWATKLKNLPHSQRVIAEKGINDIFFHAELNCLSINSISINQSLSSSICDCSEWSCQHGKLKIRINPETSNNYI